MCVSVDEISILFEDLPIGDPRKGIQTDKYDLFSLGTHAGWKNH